MNQCNATQGNADRFIEPEHLKRSFMVRCEIAGLDAEQLQREARERIASVLLNSGICLIPSELLLDNQYVVSMGVYNAAKKLVKGEEERFAKTGGLW